MAYQTGTATSQQDLIEKLNTFAVANGWTSDELDTGNKRMHIHRNNVYVGFRWDSVASTGGIAVYQALGFTGGGTPGNHPNDSGNGATGTGTVTTQRRFDRIGNGPFTNYYFFEDDVYIHIVLEYAAGLYRHCVFGELVKNGSWTGGEYCAGHTWATGVPSDSLTDQGHSVLFDWRFANDNTTPGTVHMEGLPSQISGGKWGVVVDLTTVGNDRGGTGRQPCVGGIREGLFQTAMGHYSANPNNGYIPMFPLQIFRRQVLTPEQHTLLGTVPAVRFINVKFIEPAEEFSLDADTWKVFPWTRKRWQQDNQDESGNMGLAYKKVV